ncbi:transcription antitermination factor NusB [Candidatus Kaiserbacteria bacterium RIFCSPHIGHO2_02_FULL_54_11b]|uniref:Transcription antitermination protein NusB n=2 Tax=Candidatus Kaiseribacteriota TaxID=1752734 RepID=A0A1F6CR37_9BACT|nr:MAG: transcription antitermination factor NusB [Candidatus Kaiserbacteria bacterium RIFCSPHIGHO2_01_FULL_54_36b]OGG64704.1 MAG: transcription antitermination factor NusB [Candidatus Kaiserbacteria bacterium RIFCSPHIGHO2_02_FULL_54_11b]
MANRHLARSVVLQVLFERDSSEGKMTNDEALSRLTDYGKEFGARDSDMPFMKQLLQSAIAKQKEIDEVIVRAAPEWPIDRIASIDRNILRLGLTELLFADRTQVPAKVAINEAIELAKSFGSASSGRFVNGVLGAVYVELGEPGKNEGGARKDVGNKPVKMPTEHLAGAVVYARSEGETYLAFVHDIFGHWTLSKGKIEEGEDIQAGAIREIKEEMGLDIKIVQELGVNEYVANDSKVEGGKKRKRVSYFLAESPFSELRLGSSGGLDDAQWFPLSTVGDLNFYDDTLKIIVPAINVLAKRSADPQKKIETEEGSEGQKKVEEKEESQEARTERHGGRRRR